MIKNDKHCVSRAGASDRMSRFWKSFGTLDTSLDCLFHAHLLCALSSVWHQCTYCSFHRKLSLQRTYVTLHSNEKWNTSRKGSTFIEISSYHWLAIWYKLCRTRICFLQEASFLNTFWQTWHWTSVLLWTSLMCLRKFTTVLSHTSHQLFLPRMTNRIEHNNTNASLTKTLIGRQRHKALPPVSVEGGLVTKCAFTRRALQVLGLCVDFAQVALHAARVQEFEADIALNLPFPTGACEPT